MSHTMQDERFTKAWQRDAAALAAGELADPHALLGPHADGDGGATVRAWRPGAAHVVIHVDGGMDYGCELVHPAGVWVARLDGLTPPLSYEIETRYPDGVVVTAPDAYRFAPTVGDLDLHLAGEGRHEEIYERLGGHLREVDGIAGTAFAVWAPAAKSVAVVGDFNAWDGRLHPMRSLGSSGIWELFLPGRRRRARSTSSRSAPKAARCASRPTPTRGRSRSRPRRRRSSRAPSTSGPTASGSPRAATSSSTSGRCRSTRSTSARGGAIPTTPTGCSTTPSSPTSWRPTPPTWASPTSSCCR